MKKIINYIKTNKVIVILALVLLFFIYKDYNTYRPKPFPLGQYDIEQSYEAPNMKAYAPESGMGGVEALPNTPAYVNDASGGNVSKPRKTSTNYNMSVLVDKVTEFAQGLNNEVIKLGGFVVNSNVSLPKDTGGSGYMTIRIPLDQVDNLKNYIKDNSLRITSISTNSQDITDQYEDNEAKLATLNKTKAIFEDMMSKAKTIDEILRVQREILNTQAQIDRITGQQKYLAEISETTLVTIDFSTEELELPYNPQSMYSPKAIYHQAIRSLMETLNSILGFVIWVGVYAVIWVPVLLIIWVGSKMWKKRNNKKVAKPESSDSVKE